MGRGGGVERSGWSVFDGAKEKKVPATADALMAEIDNSIAALEYARATTTLLTVNLNSNSSSFDLRLADEAYRSGCGALAAGKLDAALHSLHIALANCPPHKTSALSKINSLISITSHHLSSSSSSSTSSPTNPTSLS